MAKRGVMEHRKTFRLAQALGIPRYAALGLLEGLWHWAAKNARTGRLATGWEEELADYLRFDKTPECLVSALVSAQWVDEDATGAHFIHDWSDHADEAVKKSLANNGEQFEIGSGLFREPFAKRSRKDRETVAPISRLPEPEPEPEPEPGPVPEPEPEKETNTHRQKSAQPSQGKKVLAFDGADIPEAMRPKAEEWAEYRKRMKLKPYRAVTWAKHIESWKQNPVAWEWAVGYSISQQYQGLLPEKCPLKPRDNVIAGPLGQDASRERGQASNAAQRPKSKEPSSEDIAIALRDVPMWSPGPAGGEA